MRCFVALVHVSWPCHAMHSACRHMGLYRIRYTHGVVLFGLQRFCWVEWSGTTHAAHVSGAQPFGRLVSLLFGLFVVANMPVAAMPFGRTLSAVQRSVATRATTLPIDGVEWAVAVAAHGAHACRPCSFMRVAHACAQTE